MVYYGRISLCRCANIPLTQTLTLAQTLTLILTLTLTQSLTLIFTLTLTQTLTLILILTLTLTQTPTLTLNQRKGYSKIVAYRIGGITGYFPLQLQLHPFKNRRVLNFELSDLEKNR